MGRLQDWLNEEGMTDDEKRKMAKADSTRKKSKKTLMNGLRKLEDHMDKFIEEIESEIEKVEDQPSFQYSIGLMLANMEKEQSEHIIALRQVVSTIGKKAGIIPQTRAHAKGMVPTEKPEDNEEDVRDVVDKDMDNEKEKENEA